MTFLSRTYSNADGETDSFALSFPYLAEAHVSVQFYNPETDTVTDYEGEIVFTSSSVIQLAEGPPAEGLEVRRIRTTPADTLAVNVQGKSTYNSAEMNLVHRQLLYRVQEILDAIPDEVRDQIAVGDPVLRALKVPFGDDIDTDIPAFNAAKLILAWKADGSGFEGVATSDSATLVEATGGDTQALADWMADLEGVIADLLSEASTRSSADISEANTRAAADSALSSRASALETTLGNLTAPIASHMDVPLKAANMGATRTAMGVAGLGDANIFTAALNTFAARVAIRPSGAVYDLGGNVAAVMFNYAEGAALSVAASKQLDIHSLNNAADIWTLGSAALAHWANINLIIGSGSHATSDARLFVGTVTNNGPGTTTGIYPRAIAGVGCTGHIFAYKGGVNTRSGIASAWGMQLAMDTDLGGKVDAFLVGLKSGASAVVADYGVVFGTDVSFAQAIFQGAAVGAANFLRFKNSTAAADLFVVNSSGAISECKGLTLNGASTINTAMSFSSQVTCGFSNTTRVYSLQGVTSGDYLRVLIGSLGDGVRLYGTGIFEPQWDLNLLTGKKLTVNGAVVIGGRKTGWGVPTGTFTRTTFDTATVTLPQLAERVAAFLNDHHASGGSSPANMLIAA